MVMDMNRGNNVSIVFVGLVQDVMAKPSVFEVNSKRCFCNFDNLPQPVGLAINLGSNVWPYATRRMAGQ